MLHLLLWVVMDVLRSQGGAQMDSDGEPMPPPPK